MSHTTIRLEQAEEAILHDEVSDEELEMAAGSGKQKVANPTVPSAIICLPFAE
jgi:hypothetical protein